VNLTGHEYTADEYAIPGLARQNAITEQYEQLGAVCVGAMPFVLALGLWALVAVRRRRSRLRAHAPELLK
jgi:hypothetical protein